MLSQPKDVFLFVTRKFPHFAADFILSNENLCHMCKELNPFDGEYSTLTISVSNKICLGREILETASEVYVPANFFRITRFSKTQR